MWPCNQPARPALRRTFPVTAPAAVSPGLGTGNALVVTRLVQLEVGAVTGLLNLSLPRVVS